jgi:hypothetical protein
MVDSRSVLCPGEKADSLWITTIRGCASLTGGGSYPRFPHCLALALGCEDLPRTSDPRVLFSTHSLTEAISTRANFEIMSFEILDNCPLLTSFPFCSSPIMPASQDLPAPGGCHGRLRRVDPKWRKKKKPKTNGGRCAIDGWFTAEKFDRKACSSREAYSRWLQASAIQGLTTCRFAWALPDIVVFKLYHGLAHGGEGYGLFA